MFEALNSGAALTVVAAVATAAWVTFIAVWLTRTYRLDRFHLAWQALEAGVELTYRTYARSIKDSREDGKLTAEEMRLARRRARDAAVEYGRTRGIDVLDVLGAEYIDLHISKIVAGTKRG